MRFLLSLVALAFSCTNAYPTMDSQGTFDEQKVKLNPDQTQNDHDALVRCVEFMRPEGISTYLIYG
jgi:hypothetical protein